LFQEGYFDSDGVRLHYIDWAGAGIPVLLLGGLGATAHLYRSLGQRLAERHRVAALTRRGHGTSDRPPSGYELDTLVDDIARFLDELQVDRAVLAGHSFAGIEIPRFAVRYPERVIAVIYLDALHVFLEPAQDPADDPAIAALDLVPKAGDLASVEAYLAFVKRSRPDVAAVWCEAVEADRLADLAIVDGRPVMDGHGRLIGRLISEGVGAHGTPVYGEVPAPALALVLGGTTNPFLPADAPPELTVRANDYYTRQVRPRIERRTSLFADAVTDARIVELDTSNHTLFIAREDETVAAMNEFLGSLPI